MITDLLLNGFHAGSLGLLVDRVAVGSFFAVSGWHKAFHPARRESLRQTFIADGCYHPAMMVVIPTGELLGGLGVAFGVLTVPAAIGLVLICLGACFLDGFKRIPSFKPLDAADAYADALYLPEVLYIALLGLIIASGPGSLSLDFVAHARGLL